MVRRRARTRVVFDTNVFIRAFLSSRPDSFNRQTVQAWLRTREIQLIVNDDLIAEYMRLFEMAAELDAHALAAWKTRFDTDQRVTTIEIGPHVTGCRDPDDDLLLSVAAGGRAEFLVTNDRDLLELPHSVKQRLLFEVLTPQAFLEKIAWLL